jgi:tripartite-type tricarboxylate transporter receptor subunit TctC
MEPPGPSSLTVGCAEDITPKEDWIVYFGPRALHVALIGIAALFAGAGIHAQTYPAKAVRMIIPFAPGGNTDIIGRVFAPKMSEFLGQQIIIDNRGGAGGAIGTEIAARSPRDGYTLLMVSSAHTINPAMVKKLPYDSIKDFAPISVIADVPTAFVVHPSLPAKNVSEFLAIARARPGEIFYSTAGRGTVGHLAAELLSSIAKIKLTAVHYKGTGPSMIDLVAGQVQFQFPSMPAAVQYTRPGRLRMIAQTGERRSGAAPDTPTMREQGLKEFIVSSGFALFVICLHATTDYRSRWVHGALVKALNDPA